MAKCILVPFDGSEHAWSALQQAIWISQKEEGSIIWGLHVVDLGKIESLYVPSAVAGYGAWSGVEYFGQLQQDMEDAGRQLLADLEEKCQQSGVQCRADLATGIVDRVIVEKATSKGADLIVMGHRGTRAAWAGYLLGSVFESVIRHAKQPVMACLEKPRPINRLLAAYDGSKTSRNALEQAIKLAQDWGLSLAVVVVDEPPRVSKEKLEEARQQIIRHGLTPEVIWRQGQPAQEILRAAESQDSDLIVLGATGHSLLAEVFFGSTVDRVVHKSKLPVLICH